MTRPRLEGVGYCARMSDIGDWAFDFALGLAQRNDTKLNVFFFPSSPHEAPSRRTRWRELMALADEDDTVLEREIRLYYEDRLGDYLNVGFRLCLGKATAELRRCLVQREYAVLVLACEGSTLFVRWISHRTVCGEHAVPRGSRGPRWP